MMKSFINLTLMLLFSLISMQAISQHHREGPSHHEEKNYESLKAKRVAFITSKVDFSVEEAEKFWPLYNELDNKLSEVRKKHRKARRVVHRMYRNGEEVPDNEIQNFLETLFKLEQEELDIKHDFYKKIKAFLPMKKIGDFYKAQHEFKREVLKAYRGKRKH